MGIHQKLTVTTRQKAEEGSIGGGKGRAPKEEKKPSGHYPCKRTSMARTRGPSIVVELKVFEILDKRT